MTIINMWIGQLLCEGLNWVVKRLVKQERPTGASWLCWVMRQLNCCEPGSVGNGYGFPSSHSQYMAYFATFLVLHLHFRHRFTPTGSWVVDVLIRLLVHAAFISWAVTVAYSRYGLLFSNLQDSSLLVQVSPCLPFFHTNSLGCKHRRHLWGSLLRTHRICSRPTNAVSSGTISHVSAHKFRIFLVSYPGRLGRLVWQRYRTTMAAVEKTMGGRIRA